MKGLPFPSSFFFASAKSVSAKSLPAENVSAHVTPAEMLLIGGCPGGAGGGLPSMEAVSHFDPGSMVTTEA